MIWVCIIVLIFLEAIAFLKYKDIKSPAVLHNILWIASLIGIKFIDMDYELNPGTVFIICFGAIIFQIGFSFSLRCTVRHHTTPITYYYKINYQAIKIITIIILIASLPSLYQYIGYLTTSGEALYDTLTAAEETLNLPLYFSHYRKIVCYLSLAILGIYWTSDNYVKRRLRKYTLIILCISVLFVASVPTRNGILSFALPLVLLFACTHKLSNKTIIFLLIIAVVGFMGIYYAISIGKYWYLYETSTNPMKVLADEIKVYLSGSIIAFDATYSSHAYMYTGRNTFRFFIAVGDAIFGTSSALKLTNEFVSISGINTNVFTIYDFYIRDFGVFYALIAQFVISLIHGASYKGMRKGELFQTYMYSLLSYPLVMQFFQDQYISLLSTWVQTVLVGWIILKAKIFVKKTPIHNSKKLE